jgi:hypothetical protein
VFFIFIFNKNGKVSLNDNEETKIKDWKMFRHERWKKGQTSKSATLWKGCAFFGLFGWAHQEVNDRKGKSPQ